LERTHLNAIKVLEDENSKLKEELKNKNQGLDEAETCA